MTEHRSPIPSMIYNAAIGGHVTNSQQIIDEDYNLEQKDINKEILGVPYNVSNPNGMGRIVLKKNDNFKQVVEAQTNGNTIFVIKYDFTLTNNVTIPANCVLKFDGGSVSGAYTLTCNNTLLDGNIIISLDTNLNGKIKNTEVFFNWFGAKGDGVTDDILPIQKAIDTCFVLENINVVTGIDGKYLISKPINLNGTVDTQRHNICLRGNSKPFPNFRKGLQILGNTGTSMLECIDGVHNVVENIDFMSNTNGSNPSTIGIVVARGDLNYVAVFNMRNCYINVGYYSEASRLYNNGFGGIGIYTNDSEESKFDNVEVLANCCLALCKDNSVRYSVAGDDRVPTSTYKSFSYTSFYGKTINSISNTVFSFNNCRFLSIGKISPAIALMSSASVHITNCFSQNALWENNNGNCNYGIYITAARNHILDVVEEGYGTGIVFDSTLEKCNINLHLDGRYRNGNGETGDDNTGLIYFLEPDANERNCNDNTIKILVNNKNAPVINGKRSNVSYLCLTRFINSNIYANVDNVCLPEVFNVFYKDNNIYLNNISYLSTGLYYSKILSQFNELGYIDDSKYYKLWEYVVGGEVGDTVGSGNRIEDIISLTSGGMEYSPSPVNYILKVVCTIFNLESSTTPVFSVAYDWEQIDENYKYSNHSIQTVIPHIVFDNATRKVMCFIKITRRIPSNNMWLNACQEITFRGCNTETGKQIVITNYKVDDISSYTAATLKNIVKYGSARPSVTPGTMFFDTNLGMPIYKNTDNWTNGDGTNLTNVTKTRGTTIEREALVLNTNNAGFKFYDTTLGKFVTWNGSIWCLSDNDNSFYRNIILSNNLYPSIDLNAYYPLFVYEIGSIPDDIGSSVNIEHTSCLTCGGDTLSPSPSTCILKLNINIINLTSDVTAFGVEYSYNIGTRYYKYNSYQITIADVKVVYDNSARKVIGLVKFATNNIRINNRVDAIIRATNVKSNFNYYCSTSAIDPSEYTNATLLKRFDDNNPTKGTIANRPLNVSIGYMYIDTEVNSGKNTPIWWDGSNWVDATGASV